MLLLVIEISFFLGWIGSKDKGSWVNSFQNAARKARLGGNVGHLGME